jgi:hypothetical protein
MIEVSNAWKEAHKQMLLPESFVEVSLEISDVTVSGTASGSNVASFANTSSIINADKKTTNEPYITLEQNRWLLDGSKTVAPAVSSLTPYTRYVSANNLGSMVMINLDSPGESIPGVTITWSGEYNEYATVFTVTAKNGSTTLKTVNVSNNESVVSTIDMPVSGYTSLEITIFEWSIPDHRHRIDSVKFGLMLVFDKNQIISYTHEMNGDPLGTELSRNAINFEVDNSDGRWNILNPSGLAKYLYEQQQLTVHYGLRLDSGIEWIQAGVFYLAEWKVPANGMTATFVARDAVEFLQNGNYSRDHCNGTTQGTTRFYKSYDEVFVIYNGDPTTESWGPDPVYTAEHGTPITIHEASHYEFSWTSTILFRTQYGWIDGQNLGSTSIDEMLTDVKGAVAASSLPNGTRLCLGSRLKNVRGPLVISEISVSQFLQQCAASHGYAIWQTSDGVIHVHTPDFLPAGDYRIGKSISYYHPETELAKPLKSIKFSRYNVCGDTNGYEEYSVGSSGDNIWVDCPYIWDNSSHSFLSDKYKLWWKNREVVSGEFRADPRLELFDTVTIESTYGDITPVVITNLKYTYNGSCRATYTGKKVDSGLINLAVDGEVHWTISDGEVLEEA